MEYRAALLASHGYAALALENLTLTDLQTEDPKLNYFEVCVILLFLEFNTSVGFWNLQVPPNVFFESYSL